MKKVVDLGYAEKCFILAGVGPMASAKTAKWIRTNVPGIHIPDNIIKRLEGAENQKQEGKQICIDMINEVKEIEGVSGIHVMAYRQEEYVAEIVHESGVLKGRQPWKREVSRSEAIAAAHATGVQEGQLQNQQDMVKAAATHQS